MNNYVKYFGISLLMIALDQATKMWVHFEMDFGTPGQIQVIGDWFKLHYTTNPGMAFGMELGSEYGKMILTSFRLVAMVGIGYYLFSLIQKNSHPLYTFCISLILGGAIGNLVDSVFYGVWLDNAPYNAPTPWFHGQVVDMIYFDLWEGYIPEWVPLWGGEYTALWPIFNIADSSIFVGVGLILLFQNRIFPDTKAGTKPTPTEEGEVLS